MPDVTANLETSPQNSQTNSTSDNKGSKPNNKGAPPNKEVTQPEKPRGLAELFADQKDETSLEISLEDDTPDDPNAPVDSIDRLTKRLKLTPEQAYEIKVPMPNGAEALTIGALKDKISDLTDFDMRVVQFDERRIKQEGEILKSQQELKSILEMLPKEAKSPEVLQKVRERQELVTRRERQATLEHIPEWRDEQKRTVEFEGIQEMLSDYGFDDTFFHSVVDHRAMKFLRDTFLMRSRIRKALEQVRDPKKLGVKPSGKGAKAPVKPNANAPRRKSVATQDDRLAAWFQSKE
jgi:hypothetical protein